MLLYNQYEILKSLYPKDKERYELKQEIIFNGYEYNYDELGDFTDTMSMEKSKYVFNILSMIDSLQISYSNLSLTDQKEIDEKSIEFKGFDGNDESDLYCYSMFIIEDLKRYEGLKVDDFNSHSKMITTYDTMYEKWSGYGNKTKLSLEAIRDIISDYF